MIVQALCLHVSLGLVLTLHVQLNPVTTDEDLEIIFSRFGNVTSCDIIRDQKTGESLNYAFIGFDSDEASEQAYFKMNNVLIDDRRIKVLFPHGAIFRCLSLCRFHLETLCQALSRPSLY